MSVAPAASSALPHEVERMLDQFLIIVAIRISHAWNRQPEAILFVGKRHAITLLRQAFADDLQSDLMVVMLHFAEQVLAPQPAFGQGAGPDDRQRPLAHIGAEEILAFVGVVP